jgi:type 1 glutamine amidotransferase
MRLIRTSLLLFLCAGASTFAPAQQNAPHKKRILAIGQTLGYQHDSVTRGLAMMWQLGRDTGLWDTYIKTDTQLITKKKLEGNAKNLDYFDAVYLFTTGELPMDDSQKADLLSFVKEDGKGIIGGHTAIDTFYKWPEYGEMMGAYFDNHPWGTFDAPVIVEDRSSPITSYFQPAFMIHDEIYQPSSIFSREKLHVLMRLDETKLDLKHKGVKRTDNDFAVAWVKDYGKGRVFYTTLGHTLEAYERTDVQKMYLEATKWALRLTDTDTSPKPKPAN